MAAQTWSIDPSHSSVNFSVRHLMIARVRGSFGKFSGTLSLDDADPSRSTAEARIEAGSIDTADEKRDGHLRSADFFEVEKFPAITFKSKRVEGRGEHFKAVGDLTLHGVTREVTLEVEATGAGKDPWGNERRGFSARTSLNRTDFGLKWNQALEAGGVLVGEKVDIEVEVSAVKAK